MRKVWDINAAGFEGFERLRQIRFVNVAQDMSKKKYVMSNSFVRVT
jgi:hypothetical protein